MKSIIRIYLIIGSLILPEPSSSQQRKNSFSRKTGRSSFSKSSTRSTSTRSTSARSNPTRSTSIRSNPTRSTSIRSTPNRSLGKRNTTTLRDFKRDNSSKPLKNTGVNKNLDQFKYKKNDGRIDDQHANTKILDKGSWSSIFNVHQSTLFKQEDRRLAKCYSVLARMRVEDETDPDALESIAKIRNTNILFLKKLRVVNHCMDLIDRAEIKSRFFIPSISRNQSLTVGPMTQSWTVAEDDVVGLRVFKNFYDVHKSWVRNLTVDGNSAYREVAEQALRNNLALFSPAHDHRLMLSGNRYYAAKRDQGLPETNNINFNYSGYVNEPLEYSDEDDLNTFWIRLPPMVSDYTFKLDDDVLSMISVNDLSIEDRTHAMRNLTEMPRSNTLGFAPLLISKNPVGLYNSSATDVSGINRNYVLPFSGTSENQESFFLTNSLIERDASSPNYMSEVPVEWSTDRPNLCSPMLLERGFINGVKIMPSEGNCTFPATQQNPFTGVTNFYLWATLENNEPLDFYKHGGGGMLGSIQYILANHDLIVLQGTRQVQSHIRNDGHFARVLANNVAEEFLCRKPPLINPLVDDVLLLGMQDDYEPPTSDQTYRLNGECMACHSYSDHLSGVWRNLVIKNAKLGSNDNTMKSSFHLPTSDNDNRIRSTQWLGYGDRASANGQWINSPSLMWSQRVTNPTDAQAGNHHLNQASFIADGYAEQIYPPENDGGITRLYQKYWSTVAPKGKLLMHDLEGNPISISVEGLDELGQTLMDTIDYHACYAKRYFKFLTNQDIELFPDFQDGTMVTNPHRFGGLLSKTQLEKFEKIKEWGKQLQSGDLDLKGVIRKIIASDYFLESINGIPHSLTEPASIISEEDLSDPKNILEQHCAGCHSGIKLYISGGALPSNFKPGVDYIVPGNPCQSYLYLYLNPENALSNCVHLKAEEVSPGNNDYMPPGNALSTEDMESIRRFISEMEE